MAPSKFYNRFKYLPGLAGRLYSFRQWCTFRGMSVYHNDMLRSRGTNSYDPCDLLLFFYLDDEYAKVLKPRHAPNDGRGREAHKKLMKARVPLRLSEIPEHIII